MFVLIGSYRIPCGNIHVPWFHLFFVPLLPDLQSLCSSTGGPIRSKLTGLFLTSCLVYGTYVCILGAGWVSLYVELERPIESEFLTGLIPWILFIGLWMYPYCLFRLINRQTRTTQVGGRKRLDQKGKG